MRVLAERFIEPSSSTENPPFKQIEERVKEWPSGETTLSESSHWSRLVGVSDERDVLYPESYRGVKVTYVEMDGELAVGRSEELTAGSIRSSWLVNAAELVELKPGAGPWFDVTIAKDRILEIADLVRDQKTDSIPGLLLDEHPLSGLAQGLKRSIPGGITYGFRVMSPVSETTQEVREFVLERIAKLRQTPEEERVLWRTWPDEHAFDDALTFARAWSFATIRTPDVGLADDGEVNFLWKGADVHVDLGFYGDGTFSYYAKDGEGKEYTDDDVPAHVGLPANLLAILKPGA